MTTRPTFLLPADQSSGTVTIAAQTDRTVLTGHVLTATLGGGATSVLWSSSTGTFDSASSLTPTYTPTTIGHQEVVCTPSGPLGAGAPAREAWDVSRPLPAAANATASTVISTLALQTEALSDTGGADGLTWGTVVQRYTTGGALEGTETVGGTSTAPTWTPSALDRDYLVTSTATDAYGRTSVKVRSVAAIAVDRPTGDIGADSAQTTLASVTLDGSAIVGATSYLWSVEVLQPADSAFSTTAAPVSPTSQTTSFTPDGPGSWRIKCVATNATGSTTFERQMSQTRPYPTPTSSLGATVQMAAGTYAPTLSDASGADGVVWLTTVTKVSDASSVTVTNSTTTTPTFTVEVGQSYRVQHRATDGYVRGVSYFASVAESTQTSATITTGAPAQQSSISGIALALTLVGTASSYAWGARLTSSGTGGSWATTGFSSSTSATPTYTRPTDDDYEIRCVVTMTDGSTPEARSTISSVNAKAGGVGIWTTTKEWDFTTDVTNASFSASGSDQTIYAADGTTAKATIRVNTRAGSPVATTAVTSGVGLSNSQTGTGAERYCSIKCTAADTGIDWAAPGDVAIDFLLTTVLQNATSTRITCGVGNAVSVSTGNHFLCRINRNAGPDHIQSGQRFDAGTGTNTANQNSSGTQPTDFAVRVIIRGGGTGAVYWTEDSSAYLVGVPTPSGSIFYANLGSPAIAVDGALLLGDPFYITAFQSLTQGAVADTVTVKKVRIQEFR